MAAYQRSTERMPFRFWDRVAVGDGCWEWQGYLRPDGRGSIRVDGKAWLAHRLAWTLWNGPIPDDLQICHHCDNPSCVRPDHLFLGTQADNIDDMVAKGRHWNMQKAYCSRGHEFDGVTSRGTRFCKTCNQNAKRRAA